MIDSKVQYEDSFVIELQNFSIDFERLFANAQYIPVGYSVESKLEQCSSFRVSETFAGYLYTRNCDNYANLQTAGWRVRSVNAEVQQVGVSTFTIIVTVSSGILIHLCAPGSFAVSNSLYICLIGNRHIILHHTYIYRYTYMSAHSLSFL